MNRIDIDISSDKTVICNCNSISDKTSTIILTVLALR